MDVHMNPSVSVLMPAFNTENYIGEAIESILNQNFEDFEFLIIDDGSTDSTTEIIEFYRSQDNRIIVHKNQNNQGLSFSLNKGLDAAKGKYIARMDADDISLPNRLRIQVDFMDSHPEVAVSSAWMKTIGKRKEELWKSPITHEKIVARLFCNNCIWHPVSIIRKDVIDNLDLRYDENYTKGQDYRFWVDIAKHQKLANISKVLHLYRIHENQKTEQPVDSIKSKRDLQTLKDMPGVRVEMLMKLLSREVTLEEVEKHQKLFFEIPFTEKEVLHDLREWIGYLKQVNSRTKKYVEPDFSKHLDDVFLSTKAKHFKYLTSVKKRFNPALLWTLFFSDAKYYESFTPKVLAYLTFNSLTLRKNRWYSKEVNKTRSQKS
jgi:glycosyltransferase involved in cell wall biosynthesis